MKVWTVNLVQNNWESWADKCSWAIFFPFILKPHMFQISSLINLVMSILFSRNLAAWLSWIVISISALFWIKNDYCFHVLLDFLCYFSWTSWKCYKRRVVCIKQEIRNMYIMFIVFVVVFMNEVCVMLSVMSTYPCLKCISV